LWHSRFDTEVREHTGRALTAQIRAFERTRYDGGAGNREAQTSSSL
jgi:hypothetical protein